MKESNKDMDIFFDKLSERKYKENDLSDLTWAICYQNKTFNIFFISYCFDKEFKTIRNFDREFPKNKSRLDFHFLSNDFSNDKEYLIEVKIYDKIKKQQINKYKKIFPNAERSIITNYNLKQEKGYKTVTWKGFIKELEIEMHKNKELDNNLINGYLKYLKNTTNYYEETIMNFTKINSLNKFFYISKNIFEKKFSENIDINVDKRYYRGIDYYGFNLKNLLNNNDFYFWVGLSFHDKNVELFFQIHHCAPEYKDNIKQEGNYYEIKENNEEKDWIYLKKEYINKIDNEILENFYKEVLEKFNIKPDKKQNNEKNKSKCKELQKKTIMDFSHLNSLLTFYKITNDIFKEKFQDSLIISKDIGEDYYGLKLKKKKDKNTCFWVGLWFDEININLGFKIEKSKNWINLPKRLWLFPNFKNFCINKNIDGQRKILEKFYIKQLNIFNIKPDKNKYN